MSVTNDPYDCIECLEFWAPILPLEPVSRAIAAELHDYRVLLDNVPKVYMHVTGGRISKPNTLASEVISEVDRWSEEA